MKSSWLGTVVWIAHAGHGEGGDSPHLALRALHYLQEPEHALPAALAGALVSVLVIRWLRRHLDRERGE